MRSFEETTSPAQISIRRSGRDTLEREWSQPTTAAGALSRSAAGRLVAAKAWNAAAIEFVLVTRRCSV